MCIYIYIYMCIYIYIYIYIYIIRQVPDRVPREPGGEVLPPAGPWANQSVLKEESTRLAETR